MERKTPDYDCCYDEMSSAIGGQSQPQPYYHEKMINEYESSRKGYNKNGLDWSGMEK